MCRAKKSRGQEAVVRWEWEGILHMLARMVMHASTETFDVEVNLVFQLLGGQHCCKFHKDDLQVQLKPAY